MAPTPNLEEPHTVPLTVLILPDLFVHIDSCCSGVLLLISCDQPCQMPFFKSKNTPTAYFRCSMAAVISSTNSMSAIEVIQFLLNPY